MIVTAPLIKGNLNIFRARKYLMKDLCVGLITVYEIKVKW